MTLKFTFLCKHGQVTIMPLIIAQIHRRSIPRNVYWNDIDVEYRHQKRSEVLLATALIVPYTFDGGLPNMRLHIAFLAILMFWNEPRMWTLLQNWEEKQSFTPCHFTAHWGQFHPYTSYIHKRKWKWVGLTFSLLAQRRADFKTPPTVTAPHIGQYSSLS